MARDAFAAFKAGDTEVLRQAVIEVRLKVGDKSLVNILEYYRLCGGIYISALGFGHITYSRSAFSTWAVTRYC